MDKKTILEAARNNVDRGNEYERHEAKKSLAISLLVTVILGLFLFLYEIIKFALGF